MPVDDVPDSTDWLATPLAGLAAVEASMRCQVCKDFYTTPMITTCSHTFCSICIRRALSNDGKCPLCRAPEQELKLRSNWSMEDCVEAFSKARPAALVIARQNLNMSISPTTCKRKNESGQSPEHAKSPRNKRTRTSARVSSYRSRNAEQTSPAHRQGNDVISASEENEDSNIEDSGNSEYDSGKVDKLVPCPSCMKRMKAWTVFEHLETCPGPTSELNRREIPPAGGLLQTQRRLGNTLERLPALNYSILKEQALRKKLAELGISNQGPRLILEKRHKEWITIWNANCDAALPSKRSKLLQDLDVWERTQGYRTSASTKANAPGTTVKDKNFDGLAWAAKHESSFQDLIANAQRSRLRARASPTDKHEKSEENISTSCTANPWDSTKGCETADQQSMGSPWNIVSNQEPLADATSNSSTAKDEARIQPESVPAAQKAEHIAPQESEQASSNFSETKSGYG